MINLLTNLSYDLTLLFLPLLPFSSPSSILLRFYQCLSRIANALRHVSLANFYLRKYQYSMHRHSFEELYTKAATAIKKKVEDLMPIATGHEGEEREAEEARAVIKCYCDQRIVGFPGVESEDEHDVTWFWLKESKRTNVQLTALRYAFCTRT